MRSATGVRTDRPTVCFHWSGLSCGQVAAVFVHSSQCSSFSRHMPQQTAGNGSSSGPLGGDDHSFVRSFVLQLSNWQVLQTLRYGYCYYSCIMVTLSRPCRNNSSGGFQQRIQGTAPTTAPSRVRECEYETNKKKKKEKPKKSRRYLGLVPPTTPTHSTSLRSRGVELEAKRSAENNADRRKCKCSGPITQQTINDRTDARNGIGDVEQIRNTKQTI